MKKRRTNRSGFNVPSHILCNGISDLIRDKLGSDIYNLITQFISPTIRMGDSIHYPIDERLFGSALKNVYWEIFNNLFWENTNRYKEWYIFPNGEKIWEITCHRCGIYVTIRFSVIGGINDCTFKNYHKIHERIAGLPMDMVLYKETRPSPLLFGQYEIFIMQKINGEWQKWDDNNKWLPWTVDINKLEWSYPGIQSEVKLDITDQLKYQIIDGYEEIMYNKLYVPLWYKTRRKIKSILKHAIFQSDYLYLSTIKRDTKIEEIASMKTETTRRWVYDYYDNDGAKKARKFKMELENDCLTFGDHLCLINKTPQRLLQIITTGDIESLILEFIHLDVYRIGCESNWKTGYIAKCDNIECDEQTMKNAQSALALMYKPEAVVYPDGSIDDSDSLYVYDQYNNIWSGPTMVFFDYQKRIPSFFEFEQFINNHFGMQFKCETIRFQQNI